jgi:hypothetical protein
LTSKLLLSIKQDEKPRHLEEVVMENYFSKPIEVDLNHILAIKKEVLVDLEDDAVNLQEARTRQMITKKDGNCFDHAVVEGLPQVANGPLMVSASSHGG